MSETPKRFVCEDDVIHETNDWANLEWLCRPGLAEAEKLLMVRARISPGYCHPFHFHPHREEIIHVESGRAEQWVGEEFRILGPGEVAIIPPGVVHATFNPFEDPLVFHAILSPGILDDALAADPDPCDVSVAEPWTSIRAGRPPCRILRDG